jgi:hypothetical protein
MHSSTVSPIAAILVSIDSSRQNHEQRRKIKVLISTVVKIDVKEFPNT